MPIGAALRGFGAILKGGKRSPTISSVKPSVHKTRKAQKDARMKEQFDKQKSRTLSDRKMGKKEMTLTEYANRRTKKADVEQLHLEILIRMVRLTVSKELELKAWLKEWEDSLEILKLMVVKLHTKLKTDVLLKKVYTIT
jgi:hypothetical protein